MHNYVGYFSIVQLLFLFLFTDTERLTEYFDLLIQSLGPAASVLIIALIVFYRNKVSLL